MSIANSTNGLVTPKPRSGGSPVATQRPAAVQQSSDLIIAQIPDVQASAGVVTKERRPAGRIISQSLSMKLVFGVGAALVIGAVLPFVYNKVTRPKPVQELPTWNERNAQALASPNTAQTLAPAWSAAPAKQTTVVVPPLPVTTGITPPPPAVGDYRPAAMRGLSRAPPQSVATTHAASPTGTPYQAAPRNPLPGRSDNPAALQADRRNDTAARFNDDLRYGNRPVPPAPAAAPVQGYPADRDYRYENSRYQDPRYDNRAPQGSPLMPANNYGAGNYRDQPGAEPGVARFDGTVTNPPVRTNP